MPSKGQVIKEPPSAKEWKNLTNKQIIFTLGQCCMVESCQREGLEGKNERNRLLTKNEKLRSCLYSVMLLFSQLLVRYSLCFSFYIFLLSLCHSFPLLFFFWIPISKTAKPLYRCPPGFSVMRETQADW